MSRCERVCESLPGWALRKILETQWMRSWWAVAWLELWRRSVEEVTGEAWPVRGPEGVQ
jgi:hypothetical protein